ncbi:LysR family transcriptional regulator [Lacisediminimonas profundi]|uniref:LysR family transcriptional regulator n=1 Tax=Lacisediminimonas profundi TaxID=2603856 RepID=UPI00124BAD2E|nr:LysR family transcriptional regulator [Lacisediminimonas profundi]
MNVSTRQLRAFLLIARLRNFTRAAEMLHMTQAGLSIMVREMETQLGHRLFDRTTRGVTLTAAGEKLLPVAASAIEGLDSVAGQIGDMAEKARATLRVAATPLVSANLLPLACASFRASHPEVTVRLVDTDIAEVGRLVENGEADIGLGFFFQSVKGIERSLLYSFPLMRVSPLGARRRPAAAADVPSVPWSALKDDILIGLPPDNPIQRMVEKELVHIGRGNEERLVFNHFDTLIAMVEAGMGSVVIPSFAMVACRRHRVRTELLSDPAVKAGFHQIARRGTGRAYHAAEFTETLAGLLPNMLAGMEQ